MTERQLFECLAYFPSNLKIRLEKKLQRRSRTFSQMCNGSSILIFGFHPCAFLDCLQLISAVTHVKTVNDMHTSKAYSEKSPGGVNVEK